jgi:APA family basic amino acid/polyamine antiporter
LFIGFAAFYVVSTVANDINNYKTGVTPVINSLLGLAITAIGIPLYWYFTRAAIDKSQAQHE